MTWGSAPAIRECSSSIVCLALALRWHTCSVTGRTPDPDPDFLLVVGGTTGQVGITVQRDRPSATAKCR